MSFFETIDAWLRDAAGNPIASTEEALHTTSPGFGVPPAFTKQTANGEAFLLQEGQLNNLRLRPQIMNEHAESSRNIQGVVNATTIVGQYFKPSQDNINAINLTLESAAAVVVDNFESYADSAALQAAWIATGGLAVLETTEIQEGTQAMWLDTTVGTIGDEFEITIPSIDYTGYTGSFQLFSNKVFADNKMRLFLKDTIGNTSSVSLVQANSNVWTKIVISDTQLEQDASDTVTAADLTQIVGIGYRVAKQSINSYMIIDAITATPGPGSVEVKLWNMGATLPVSGVDVLTDQYTKLGDLGITGQQLSSVPISLLGGKRMYHLDEFVAGVALEIPGNEVLIPNNYYAITIHYVDTDVNVYGPNEAWVDYYVNGYGFTTPDEVTAPTAMGADKDIQFIIFSTQEVYIFEVTIVSDGLPGHDSITTLYIEDENMVRTDVLVSGIHAVPVVTAELKRPFKMVKGGKLEQEYNDSIGDDVSEINLIMSYFFIPPTVNG
jgi:hypothetical protein